MTLKMTNESFPTRFLMRRTYQSVEHGEQACLVPIEIGTFELGKENIDALEAGSFFLLCWPFHGLGRGVDIDRGKFARGIDPSNPDGFDEREQLPIHFAPDSLMSEREFEPSFFPFPTSVMGRDLEAWAHNQLEPEEEDAFNVVMVARYASRLSVDCLGDLPLFTKDSFTPSQNAIIAGLVMVYYGSKPGPKHYGIARQRLESNGFEATEERIQGLAAGIRLTINEIFNRVAPDLTQTGEKLKIHRDRQSILKDGFRSRETMRLVTEYLSEATSILSERVDGMTCIDATLCDVLSELDMNVEKLQRSSRKALEKYEGGFESWRNWFKISKGNQDLGQLEAPFVRYLADALCPKVIAQLEAPLDQDDDEDPEREFVPALAHVVFEGLAATIAPRNNLWINEQGTEAELQSPENVAIARVARAAAPFVEDVLQDGIDALRSYYGMSLLVGLVQKVHEQHASGVQNSNTVSISGGLRALMEELGLTTRRASKALREALNAGPAWQPTHYEGKGLWTWMEKKARGQRDSLLMIAVAPQLTPSSPMIHKRRGPNGLMTPLLDLAPAPGSNRDKASIARFQLGVVHELSLRSNQIPNRGGVVLSRDVLCHRADQASMPEIIIDRTLDAWSDKDNPEALLERVDRGVYHLADNQKYGAGRRFLDAQGSLRLTNSRRGKASAARRRRSK